MIPDPTPHDALYNILRSRFMPMQIAEGRQIRNPHATSHLITQSLMKQTSLRPNATSIAHDDRQFVALDEQEGTKQGTIRSSPPQQISPS